MRKRVFQKMTTSLSKLQEATDARHVPAQPLVLVADDHEDTRLLVRTVLEVRGYSVIEAADGEETVRTAESARPDLILMDGSLPRLNGIDATRRIRTSDRIGRVPIVFISGHTGASFLALAREAGCDEYLVKPFDLAELDQILEKYRGNQRPELSPLDLQGVFKR